MLKNIIKDEYLRRIESTYKTNSNHSNQRDRRAKKRNIAPSHETSTQIDEKDA